MSAPQLSIVVPLYNEGASVDELVERTRRAADMSGLSWELILVDDHSDDGSQDRLAELAQGDAIEHLRLPLNVGQFRATRAGLRASRGATVVVLDGDLQDPPEVLVELLAALERSSTAGASAFALKSSREEGLLFRMGHGCYAILSGLAAWSVPPGAGSYCAMSGALARRIGDLPVARANLAPLVAAGSKAILGVHYGKEARRDGHSRVGPLGLVGEALGTLALSGSIERLCMAAALGFLVLERWPVGLGWALASWSLSRRRRRVERLLR